jgi:hypothetical protein
VSFSINSPAPPQIWEIIGQEVLSAPATAFADISVGTGYKFIRVMVMVYNNSGGNSQVAMRLNADSGAHYNVEYCKIDTATITASQAAGATGVLLGYQTPASDIEIYEILINNTTAAISKGFTGHGGGIRMLSYLSGQYTETAEISSIRIYAAANMDTGSRLVIHGVK